MYVKVVRENGADLVVNLEDDVRRFDCSNADVKKAIEDGSPLLTTCACCARRLVVMLPDVDHTPVVVAWLKGGRSH